MFVFLRSCLHWLWLVFFSHSTKPKNIRSLLTRSIGKQDKFHNHIMIYSLFPPSQSCKYYQSSCEMSKFIVMKPIELCDNLCSGCFFDYSSDISDKAPSAANNNSEHLLFLDIYLPESSSIFLQLSADKNLLMVNSLSVHPSKFNIDCPNGTKLTWPIRQSTFFVVLQKIETKNLTNSEKSSAIHVGSTLFGISAWKNVYQGIFLPFHSSH